MEHSEFDSFIRKFCNLWHLGADAHLDVETRAGQAWVGLRVRLGQAQGDVHPHQNLTRKARSSPSRVRRREQRAAARKMEAEEATTNDIVNTMVDEE